MKKFVATVALVLAMAAIVDVVGDLTQSRPEPRPEGSTTTIEFTVSTRSFRQSDESAAFALWSVCAATVDRRCHHADPGRRPVAGDHLACPRRKRRTKVVGCLEDLTIERILGDVCGALIGLNRPE